MRLIRWPRDGVTSDVWMPGWGDRPSAPRRNGRIEPTSGGSCQDGRPKQQKTLRDLPQQLSLFDELSRAMKPQQRTPFEGPFMVLLCALTFVVVEGIAVQVGGQVASLVFGGHRLVPGGVGAEPASSCGFGSIRPTRLWRGARPTGLHCPDPWPCGPHCSSTQLVRCRARHRDHPVVRHLRAASGTLPGGPAKASRAHVERTMGRKCRRAPHRRPLRQGCRRRAGATGTRCGRRHRRPAVRQVRGLHPRRRRAPGRQGRGVRDPSRAAPQGPSGGDRHSP